jgi:hypothetical protein
VQRHVRDERIEPDDVRGFIRVDVRVGSRVEHQRAGQEIETEIKPAAAMDEILQLLVGLGITQPRIDIDEHELRNGQPDGPGDLTRQPFGNEGPRTLAGAMELDDVEAVVVRLDQAGKGATLAQGRDVAGRSDVAGFRHRAGVYLRVVVRSESNRASRGRR